MPKLLSQPDIEKELKSVPEWKHVDETITRQFTFGDFREVVSFLVLIAFDAEEADHHPDVEINYKRLRLSLSTHSEGGLTKKDFDLARVIDKHFQARS